MEKTSDNLNKPFRQGVSDLVILILQQPIYSETFHIYNDNYI